MQFRVLGKPIEVGTHRGLEHQYALRPVTYQDNSQDVYFLSGKMKEKYGIDLKPGFILQCDAISVPIPETTEDASYTRHRAIISGHPQIVADFWSDKSVLAEIPSEDGSGYKLIIMGKKQKLERGQSPRINDVYHFLLIPPSEAAFSASFPKDTLEHRPVKNDAKDWFSLQNFDGKRACLDHGFLFLASDGNNADCLDTSAHNIALIVENLAEEKNIAFDLSKVKQAFRSARNEARGVNEGVAAAL